MGLEPFARVVSFVLRNFGALVAVALSLAAHPVWAANVPLTASDAIGTSSFNAAGHWSNGVAPAAGNAYFTGPFVLRTPANTTSYAFGGDSLSIDSGGRFLLKTTGTSQTITVNNLILNGGNFEQATANSDSYIVTVAGGINVATASGIGALGGTATPSASFETLLLTATISGSASLQLGGPTLNAGADSGVVELSAANPYSGTLTVSGGVIASAANRLLQLNNLNALSNATLTLNATVANPLSFTAGANTGPFSVGQLAGTASQALADTAGRAVTLSVGGNNGSSIYSGGLTGPGALLKAGSGTLTLAGPNSYSGGTTVSNGTLQATKLSGTYSGGGTVVLMASSAQMPQTVTAAAIPFTGRWVVAGGWLAGAGAGALGTNSITVDPQYPLGPTAAGVPVSPSALFEPQYDLNSAGVLTLTNGGQLFLHQNCAFAGVVIEGVSLTNGIYAWQDLAIRFPGNIAPNGAGYVAVQPYGALPAFPPQAAQFLVQPRSQTGFTGLNAQFVALVYGTPAPTLQWQAGAIGGSAYTNLPAGGQFLGIISNALTITNLSLANVAKYILVASNPSGSVTSAPAVLTMTGPAVLTNASGLTLSMAADGTYTLRSTAPAWTFTGSLGMAPAALSSVARVDAFGPYTEFQFQYSANVGHSAGIRLYTERPVVLFTDTSLADSANDLAFPHLTAYPANLYHESFSSSAFSPRTFSQLVTESPWVFFSTNFDCFILSPATNYMIAADVMNGDGSISCGIQPAITQLPAGFTHRTVLTIESGINAAFGTWGNALTALAGKVRPANDSTVELNKLGYWTDNGASYYYSYVSSLGYAGTLLAVRDQFATNGFPLGYLQLDSWFYPKGVANTWQGDATNNRGGLDLYQPDPTLFPAGLAAFQQQLGLPLITHCRWVDGASPYRSQYAMSANVIVDPAYWADRMAYLKSCGVVTFEHDWLDVNALPLMNLTDPPAFMNQMAGAAANNGLNLQYCMGLPRHFLQSSLYSNLVTLRVSGDRFESGKWNAFLYNSCLANALGAWPWTDVYPSIETRSVLLGTLSAGPVGVGDALGALSAGNLAKAVRPDGIIVKPDVALAPLDQSYVSDAQGANLPMVAATHVDNGELRALYVFSYARNTSNTNASFTPGQLGLAGPAYVYDYFSQTGSVVSNGDAFSFSTTAAGNTSGGVFHVVVPIGPSGIGFLGDTNKFVTLGKKRVSTLSDTGVLKATVLFGGSESNIVLCGYAPVQPYAWALSGSVGAVAYDATTHIFTLNVAPDASKTSRLALSLSAPPILRITNLGGTVQLSWPAAATGYALESATTLQPSANWLPCTNAVNVLGGQNVVTLIPASQAAFYRLKQ